MRTAALAAVLLIPAAAFAAPKEPVFTASSEKKTDKTEHTADKAFDGLLTTSWAEDAAGPGDGAWLQLELPAPVTAETLHIWGGFFAGSEEWNARSRLAEASVIFIDEAGEEWKRGVEFGDRFSRKDVPIKKPFVKLRVVADSVHEGAIFPELHISEIAWDLSAAADPAWQEAIDKQVAKDRKLKEVVEGDAAAWDAVRAALKANEDYRTNFKLAGARAVRGPEWRVALVQKHVPVGRRLASLQFDEEAVELLGVLKDANAIPYLETAAAGAISGDDREWLGGAVKMFRAYQEFRRSERGTVPNWGSTGYERGALNGRGEPTAMDVDSAGNLWVADVGNNRVQRFTSNGTADLLLCTSAKSIVTSWFGQESEPYVSACDVGEGPGQYHQPMALAVGNYDIVAVVDSRLRVQTMDAEGQPKAQWQIDSAFRPSTGLGNGTPIVTWLGDDFYFVVKDEVLVYTAEGELKRRYNLEGGDVQAAVIAAGKLIVRHSGERDLIEYKPEDGFRLGAFSKKPVPDDGSEDWDLATDAKDNLYVATDAGMVHKYNKRGKFLGSQELGEGSFDMPRLAVNGPLIYVAHNDTITRVEQTE